jgi:hypothetical protein
VAATQSSVKNSDLTFFALYLHTIDVPFPISLMQLRGLLHETRSDQSVRKGNKFFSKKILRDHCAHSENGLMRPSRKSFDGDRSSGDRLMRVLPAPQARFAVLDVAWRSQVHDRPDDAILNRKNMHCGPGRQCDLERWIASRTQSSIPAVPAT